MPIIIHSFSSAKTHILPSSRTLPLPYPFPIVGNMFQLGQNPHRTFTALSKIHGPLMRLKLGCLDAIIVSSPELAEEILRKHDNSFPSRWMPASARVLGHHAASMACLPVSTQWRNLRKICKEQLFSNQQLDSGRALRQEMVKKLLHYAQTFSVQGHAMDIREAPFVTSLNQISNTLFSFDFADYGTAFSGELKGIIRGLMTILGSPNLADYFRIFRQFDPQGIKRESEFYMGKLLGIFDEIIDQRLEMRKNSDQKKNDFLEALLQMDGDDEHVLSRSAIKHLLLDLVVAGTDTSSSTLEWVMTELLRNRRTMSKVKMELNTIIGQNKPVEESDISSLPYLQAMIKESLRYHPPVPFLGRRQTNGGHYNLTLNNYTIPKDVVIFINLWAIARDASVWPNPESFMPERFLNGKTIDVKGQNFDLIPFGAGRRICPGLALASRMVHLTVASLVHSFDWKLEEGIEPEDVDISEKFGGSLEKAIPLKAVPLPVA